MAKTTTKVRKGIGVVVTTSHRDVWFGVLGQMPKTPEKVLRLLHARHGYYWGTGIDGIGGLAATGPGPGAKIGAVVPELQIRDVVAVLRCSDAARDRWESATWAK